MATAIALCVEDTRKDAWLPWIGSDLMCAAGKNMPWEEMWEQLSYSE